MRSLRKVRKWKVRRRLFALGMAGVIVLQGTPALAQTDYKKSYSMDGVTYKDIYDGSASKRGSDETDAAIAAVTHNGALEAWAKVASNVFASDKKYYYPYSKDSFKDTFGKNGRYLDLVSALGNSGRNLTVDKSIPCPLKIKTRYKPMNKENKEPDTAGNISDSIWRTGLQVANSRKSAMDAMMQVIPDMRENSHMTADRMIERNYIPALDNSDADNVLYTFVGANQQRGGTLGYEYNVLGLVFYDFQYCPIPDEEVTYFSDETNNVINSPSKYVNEKKSSDQVDVNSLQYFRSTDSKLDISSLDNSKSSTPSTLTLSKSEGTTNSVTNTFTDTKNVTYGQTISNAFRFGKANDFFGSTLTLGFSFTEAYTTAFANTETSGTSENKSSTASYQVPAYSIMSVAQDTTEKEVELEYKNAVVISYKVAVVGMNGSYYCDAGNLDLKGYTQNQICTIFGSADRNGANYSSTDDAITNMIKRYKKAKKDGNNANEENFYTLATKKYSKSKHDANVKNGKKKNWLTKTPVINWNAMDKVYNQADLNNTMDSKHHVMNVTGAHISGKTTETKYTVSDPALCKPLNQTKTYTDDNLRTVVTSKNISVDNSINLSDYVVAGFFKDGTKFPLDATKGTWVIVDDNGNEIKDSDIAALKKNAGKNLVLQPKKPGTVNLMYMIDEGDNAYYYLDSKNVNTKITNDSLQSAAMIEVNIHSNAASAAAASIFSGENKAGVVAIVFVLVLILAGTGFVIYRKRKTIGEKHSKN